MLSIESSLKISVFPLFLPIKKRGRSVPPCVLRARSLVSSIRASGACYAFAPPRIYIYIQESRRRRKKNRAFPSSPSRPEFWNRRKKKSPFLFFAPVDDSGLRKRRRENVAYQTVDGFISNAVSIDNESAHFTHYMTDDTITRVWVRGALQDHVFCPPFGFTIYPA